MKWIGWLLLVGLTPVAHATPLKLAAAVEHTAILRPFIHDWFGRAGIDFQLIPCTYARCEKLIEADHAVDGDMARSRALIRPIPTCCRSVPPSRRRRFMVSQGITRAGPLPRVP